MARLFYILGALSAGLAVAIGAYAAHASSIDEVQVLWLEKGARYQMYHGLALILTALTLVNKRKFKALTGAAGFCFIGGTLCFSGSLYVMSFTPFEAGLITPLGGMLFIVGWALLAAGGTGGKK